MRLSTSQGCNTPLLYTARMAARSVGAITSNSLTNSISLIHTLAASDGTATLLLTLGADLYTVSKILGHRSIRMTEVYAKIVDKKKIETMNLVNNMFV